MAIRTICIASIWFFDRDLFYNKIVFNRYRSFMVPKKATFKKIVSKILSVKNVGQLCSFVILFIRDFLVLMWSLNRDIA